MDKNDTICYIATLLLIGLLVLVISLPHIIRAFNGC